MFYLSYILPRMWTSGVLLGLSRLVRHGWMSLFKLDKSNFCVAQSTFKRRFGNCRGPRKRFFLLETDGNWSDRRLLMGFISWPLVYERGKVYWNQGSNSAQLLFIDPKLRKTSRQNQKPHVKNKILPDKTKNLTGKPKSSRQNQILHSKNQITHGKSKYPRQNQSYFVFAVKYLVLPWSFWFCREVFCFCLEVFGFAVRYFVFAVRFLVLPWCFCFCREVFGFAVTVVDHHSTVRSISALQVDGPANNWGSWGSLRYTES